jgi:hypothetical protein
MIFKYHCRNCGEVEEIEINGFIEKIIFYLSAMPLWDYNVNCDKCIEYEKEKSKVSKREYVQERNEFMKKIKKEKTEGEK